MSLPDLPDGFYWSVERNVQKRESLIVSLKSVHEERQWVALDAETFHVDGRSPDGIVELVDYAADRIWKRCLRDAEIDALIAREWPCPNSP